MWPSAVANTSRSQHGRRAKGDTMMYQISYGPPGSRQVESIENINFAADRYCELANKAALNIELSVEGMPLSPVALLRACPANSSCFLRHADRRTS